MVGHMACMEEKRNAYTGLMGTREGKRQLRRLSIDGNMILK